MRSENKLRRNVKSHYLFYSGKESVLFNMIFIFCFLSLTIVSCGNSEKKTNDNQNTSSVLEDLFDDVENIDIPISLSLGHTDDEDMRQLVDAEYEITSETDNDVFIDINSDYYKKYMSGNRFVAPQLAFFENSENVELLTLNLDVVNNTDESLSVSELNVIVEESKPDTIPVIYICSTESYSNCLYLVNESWFNWGGLTLSYSIMKEGESFDGHYRESRHISYFDDYVIVDFLPDMEAMGYDLGGLIDCIRNRNIEYNRKNNVDFNVEPWEQDDSNKFLYFSLDEGDADLDFFQDKFKPFGLKKDNFDEYVGRAVLYGSLSFDNIDFKVDFVVELSLSTSAGFGALSYENDSFDVKLKNSGEDYVLRYPYTTVIEPYGAEYIKLTVTADKSSTHRFKIDIKNDNGLKVKSKSVHFHNYRPKN